MSLGGGWAVGVCLFKRPTKTWSGCSTQASSNLMGKAASSSGPARPTSLPLPDAPVGPGQEPHPSAHARRKSSRAGPRTGTGGGRAGVKPAPSTPCGRCPRRTRRGTPTISSPSLGTSSWGFTRSTPSWDWSRCPCPAWNAPTQDRSGHPSAPSCPNPGALSRPHGSNLGACWPTPLPSTAGRWNGSRRKAATPSNGPCF